MSSPPPTKKSKTEEIPEHLSQLNEETKKALVDIDGVQSEIDTLNETASREILKIEQKYNGLRKPLYVRRAAFTKSIPNFWSQSILNHSQLGGLVLENENDLLNCITNIEVDEEDDIMKGYKIRFLFSSNEFFENEKIEKVFVLGEHPSSTTTPIKWKAGKENSFPHGEDDELQSFFSWLTSTSEDPTNDEIAEIIKDDLYPNPVQYFICPDVEDLSDSLEELGDEDDMEEVDEDGSED